MEEPRETPARERSTRTLVRGRRLVTVVTVIVVAGVMVKTPEQSPEAVLKVFAETSSALLTIAMETYSLYCTIICFFMCVMD